jgi:Cu/Ag efflux protein CusF
MKTTRILGLVAVLLMAFFVPAYAGDRPHEGKIVGIDTTSRQMLIQGEKGDQWTLFWTESTKLKNDLTFPELKAGDEVHFDYVMREGKMFLTELKRTEKAER